jgi:hypothetical protein
LYPEGADAEEMSYPPKSDCEEEGEEGGPLIREARAELMAESKRAVVNLACMFVKD